MKQERPFLQQDRKAAQPIPKLKLGALELGQESEVVMFPYSFSACLSFNLFFLQLRRSFMLQGLTTFTPKRTVQKKSGSATKERKSYSFFKVKVFSPYKEKGQALSFYVICGVITPLPKLSLYIRRGPHLKSNQMPIEEWESVFNPLGNAVTSSSS